MQIDENTLTIIMLLVVGLLLLVVPQWRTRQAVNQLIKRFRDAQALDENSAKTPEQLNVRLTGSAPSNIFGTGDPVQSALNVLRDANVIILTNDGKLYLSENNLSRSKWNTARQ